MPSAVKVLDEFDLDKRLQLAVSDMVDLKRASALNFALRVGEIVVLRLFDGDIQKFRKHTLKDVSIRRLAERPDLPISPTRLSVAISVFEMWRRLSAVPTSEHLSAVPTSEHLGLSHYEAVLVAPRDQQRNLLERASVGYWSVRQLRDEVGEARVESTAHRSRLVRRAAALWKGVRKLEQLLGDVEPNAESEMEPLLSIEAMGHHVLALVGERIRGGQAVVVALAAVAPLTAVVAQADEPAPPRSSTPGPPSSAAP